MKWFEDGNQIVITKDDFINLQESPTVFVNSESDTAKIIRDQGIIGLPIGDLFTIRALLNSGGGEYWCPLPL